MLANVLQTIKANSLTEDRDSVVVAVSGGADSVALLHILLQLRSCLGISLYVASLDHGVRAQDSRDDLAFVGELSKHWELPFAGGHADVPLMAAQSDMGIEEAARRARYDFLAQLAERIGANCVAVGHHAQDQAETIMMRILRGAGLRGIRGMSVNASMPYHSRIRLIRPLLYESKCDILAYCNTHNLPYRHDSSNDDRRYLRNFVRHRVIAPMLERNPKALDSFARLADSASADEEYLSARFEIEVTPHVKVSEDAWRIEKTAFKLLHASMKRRFLRRAMDKLAGEGKSLPHSTVVAITDWLDGAAVGKNRDLGRGIQLRVDYDKICIETHDAEPEIESYLLLPESTFIKLVAPASFRLGDVCIRLETGCRAAEAHAAIHLPAVPLYLRTRRKGERFRPKGMNGKSRKIKSWMIDRKIPRYLRERIPIVSTENEAIAICVGDRWHLADGTLFDGQAADGMTLILE